VKYQKKRDALATRERKQVVVDGELDRILKRHGTLTAELMVDEARDPKSRLHRYFQWDDKRAADEYRLAQARSMIAASKFVLVLEDVSPAPDGAPHRPEVRRLVSAFKGEGFKMRNQALADGDTRAKLIENFIGRLRGWCNSTVDIEELAEVRSAIEEELSKMTRERQVA
jgi:hypothetical protein